MAPKLNGENCEAAMPNVHSTTTTATPNAPILKRVTLSLEQNAKDSLIHGVEHFTDGSRATDLKYAMLHTFHAVELYLKAALAKQHPLLILEKPEEAHKPRAKTVAFPALVGRLRAAGVELSESDLKDLDAIRAERNEIEHYQVDLVEQDAKDWIGRAVRFLSEFVEENFDERLYEILEPAVWSTLTDAIYSWEEKIRLAMEAMPQHGPNESLDYQDVTCPECYQDTIPYTDDDYDDNRVRCRLCATVFYSTECSGCGCVMLFNKPITSCDIEECSGCLERRFADD